MAPPLSLFKSVSPSTTLRQGLLVSLIPSVLGACITKTVTETAWVTVPGTQGAVPSTVAPHSSAYNLSTIALSIPSIVSTGALQQSTSVNTPPSLGASGTPSSTATATASYNPFPKPAPPMFAAPEKFNTLNPSPNMGSIRNSCGYDVYVWSVGCGDTASNVKIAAGTTWTEPLRRCAKGGVVYKVSKTDGDAIKVMQFEAGVWADKDIVQYDLSYLNCMVPETTDLSACPGWEGGHQAVAGKGCQVFTCKPGEYCDGSSYTVAEFGYQGGGIVHPNAGCAASKGIAFELCACTKA